MPRFDASRAQFNTWLFTIARNLAFNLVQVRRSHDHANATSYRDALDELLTRNWLQTPPDFTQRVMQRLPRQAVPAASTRPRRARWQRLRWLPLSPLLRRP